MWLHGVSRYERTSATVGMLYLHNRGKKAKIRNQRKQVLQQLQTTKVVKCPHLAKAFKIWCTCERDGGCHMRAPVGIAMVGRRKRKKHGRHVNPTQATLAATFWPKSAVYALRSDEAGWHGLLGRCLKRGAHNGLALGRFQPAWKKIAVLARHKRKVGTKVMKLRKACNLLLLLRLVQEDSV